MKRLAAILSATISIIFLGATVSAHVVVVPSQVGVAEFQTFSVSVPAEKDVPTVALRLLIPAGLAEVTPTVKPGWQISTKTTAKTDEVTEIDWTGGSIPPGQRDDFTFNAQAPSTATNLEWKAYQTYQDGSVVSWDKTPNGSDDATGDNGPYSITRVINDIDSNAQTTQPSKDKWPYAIAGFALLISLFSLAVNLPRRK